MTEPKDNHPLPESERPSAAAAEAPENAPEAEAPEPWTPARVTEWNAYYDLYVMLAALLLVFIASCNYMTDSHFWLRLKTGELISQGGGPPAVDPFSYTEAGKPWMNGSWLFDWAQSLIYHVAYGFVPVNPQDPTANRVTAEQVGVGTTELVSAFLRLLTAWILLRIRHRGPGLWWTAICVVLALGVVFHPLFGLAFGGIAGPGSAAPVNWGLLLLALEMWVLFQALERGRVAFLGGLVPLFVLWANVDDSFLIGLLVLAGAAIGRLLDGKNAAGYPQPVLDSDLNNVPAQTPAAIAKPAVLAGVLGASILACLVNPFTYKAFLGALEPYLHLFQPAGKITTLDRLSFFSFLGSGWRNLVDEESRYLLPAYYLVLVAAGLIGFIMNTRRFTWRRFLPFAITAILWGLLIRAGSTFAIVFAVTLALNGQEWWLDRFGARGKLGLRWSLWSTGGRMATLAVVFAMVALDITGLGSRMPEIQFGVGFQPDDFAFESANFLDAHPQLKGNVLNTSLGQGDMMIWKTGGKRKTYVDGRARFFPQELLEQWNDTRKAISEDDVAKWKPLLDAHDVSVVMIEPSSSPLTYRKLMTSPNWIAFHDDGRVVMFGRTDAAAEDVALFQANSLDPERRAYTMTRPVAPAERPPNTTSWIDSIFLTRTLNRPRSRTESSRRLLEGLDSAASSESLPDPARCLLAIQEARTALAQSPDDWIAYRRLKDAYRYLMQQEAAMLAGMPITPENGPRIRRMNMPVEMLMNRYRQRVTALNYAIQTTPPPGSDPARRELAGLQIELYQLYLGANALDLARNRLRTMLEASQPDDFSPEERTQFERDLAALDERIKGLENKLEDLAIEGQASTLQQASYALSQGGTEWAIFQLAEAERNAVSPALVKPQLVDLYCNTGQPDKALELLTAAIEDPNLGMEPGTSALRQGQVYFLLGNYNSAATMWKDRAIPRLRYERTARALSAGQSLTRGEGIIASNAFLSLPSMIGQQASWEFDLAMCQLESGVPLEAAEHFTKALTIYPDLPVRAIAAYYLEKMGKPVPPPSKAKTPVAATTSPAAAARLNINAAPIKP